MTRPSARSVVMVSALVLTVCLSSTAGAVASRLITSRDIKNGTIQRIDLAPAVNGALNAVGKPGPQGTAGSAGAKGDTGPKGDPGQDGKDAGPDKIYTWTTTFTGDGETTGYNDHGVELTLKNSGDGFPAYTEVQGLNAEITSGEMGLWEQCPGGFAVHVVVAPSLIAGTAIATFDSDHRQETDRAVFSGYSGLRLKAHCRVDDGTGSRTYGPLPTFTARFTFSTRLLATAPTEAFS